MCTNGVLFIQRVNKIKTQVHKRYCTAVWFYNGYRKKKQILKMFLTLIPLQIDCNVLDEAYICNLNFL